MLFPLLWGGLLSVAQAQNPTVMKVMSYNIRYANPNDAEAGNGWEKRKELVAALIGYHAPDLLGMQEALHAQVAYLDSALPDFAWIGFGRDDGKQAGEYAPIFYRKSQFELLGSGTFWLSKTPEKPSKAWDAALPRICTWGHFKAKGSGQEFYYFNTHFDHRGEKAREESAKLIAEKVSAMSGRLPAFVSGDFNCHPNTAPYKAITQTLSDAHNVAQAPPYGPDFTFGSFDVGNEQPGRIDYIFVKKSVKVLKTAIFTDQLKGKYPSDHLPVMAELVLDGQ